MKLIDAIKQQVQETGKPVPEWAMYATQVIEACLVQFWEEKPVIDGGIWNDKTTVNSKYDFEADVVCEDADVPLKITDGVRAYVNRVSELDTAAAALKELLDEHGVLAYYHDTDDGTNQPTDVTGASKAIYACGFSWPASPQGSSFWSDVTDLWADMVSKIGWGDLNRSDPQTLAKAKYEATVKDSPKVQTSGRSDGSTASYYELPDGVRELQDLISHRNMNAQIGEIFRACYRYGLVEHSEMLRDAKKIKFYAEAEIARLKALD